MIAVDTGYFYALADAGDAHHARALAWQGSIAEGWITTWPVLTETCHLLARRLAPAAASDLMRDVAEGLERMAAFDAAVRGGAWRGHDGQPIADVVAIGIGGSHLGPQLACEALREHALPAMRVRFLSNVDPGAWEDLHPALDPARTLFVVASKSWGTVETARNAEAARRWLLAAGVPAAKLGRHIVGITANPAGARAFGLDDDGIFPFRDWVGGRLSLWSAIGLPVVLAVGADGFRALLRGARGRTCGSSWPWSASGTANSWMRIRSRSRPTTRT